MLFRWVAAALAAAIAVPANAAWYEAKSKHFIIYSDEDPARLSRFAERLEHFDQTVRFIRHMDDPALPDSARLRVYTLANEDEVSRLIGSKLAAGMYEARASGSVAFVPRIAGEQYTQWDLDSDQIFFHEYAHHLQLQNASIPLPTWFVEGFAEFFATTEFEKDGSVILGKYPKYRAYSFFNDHGLGLDQMLGGTYGSLSADQVDALYAQGWLLTHFLTFEKSRQGQLAKYVEGIQNGLAPLESAKAAFGDLKVLKRDLVRYASGSILALRLNGSALSTVPITVRALRPGEAAMMAVHIRSTRGVSEKSAQGVADEARKAAEPYPKDTFAQSVLAEAEYDAGNYQAAEAAADRALAADANNVRALIYKGRAQMSVAFKNPAGADWNAIRGWFLKANRIETENAEPLSLFYQSFAAQKQKPSNNAVDGLLYAVVLAPQDATVRLLAVRELLVENRAREAKTMLAPLAFRPHSSAQFRGAISAIMTAISSGDTKAALSLVENGPDKASGSN